MGPPHMDSATASGAGNQELAAAARPLADLAPTTTAATGNGRRRPVSRPRGSSTGGLSRVDLVLVTQQREVGPSDPMALTTMAAGGGSE